jgi:hypothetical protein
MTYNEWVDAWKSKYWEMKSNSNYHASFDASVIATILFPNNEMRDAAYYELAKFGEKDSPLVGFCERTNREPYLKIHRMCHALPFSLKVCEYFQGSIVSWDNSILPRPPFGGGTYIPEPVQPNKSSNSNGGCYIATACYGSYDCAQVLTFRNFRDEYLNKSIAGRAFVRTYYALSPNVAIWLKDRTKLNHFVRCSFLDPLYNYLKERY